MFRLTRREQVIVISFLVVILVVSGIYLYGRPEKTAIPLPKSGETEQKNSVNGELPKESVSKPVSEIKVDVKGAVRTPGLYTLPAGSRVADAIQAAGGTTEQADLQTVNLAQKLLDGGLVQVPAKGDPNSASQTSGISNGKLNLNTATAEQLDTINGIGSSRANAIIQYREKNGPFQSLDDLLKVKGFGSKLVESLKDQLVVY